MERLSEPLGRQHWKAKEFRKAGCASKKEILKAQEQMIPHVENLPAGKETSLAEQGELAGTQGGKGVYDLWKKGQVTQKEFKGIRVMQG